MWNYLKSFFVDPTPTPTRTRTRTRTPTPEEPPADTLTETAWRTTRGWGPQVRLELKDKVGGLAPQTQGQLEVPYFNIALTGQIAAGKSSFFNSANSIYQERIVGARAETGIAARSLTREGKDRWMGEWVDGRMDIDKKH